MDFLQTPEQTQLVNTIRQFAQTTLNDNLRDRDGRREFPDVG